MLAAKCGPQHIRSAKKVSKYDLENPNGQWFGSKSFEDKYVRAATDRISKGIRELVPPEEDKILESMK